MHENQPTTAAHAQTEGMDVRQGSRKRLLILIAGAAFVLIPNSEVMHAILRATLGVGGVQCC
jgi:hypothetical protein